MTDRATERRCLCCAGTGKVESATGDLRPCSRCRPEAFSSWSSGTGRGDTVTPLPSEASK